LAGPIRKRPPVSLSRSVEHTGSESNRGRQHQTISPLLSTKAENWQFPITPRSSRRIFGTLAQDDLALIIRYASNSSPDIDPDHGTCPVNLGCNQRRPDYGS